MSSPNKKSEPHNNTPDDATPDDSTPDNSTPDDSTPDNATPDNATPDKSNGSHKGSSSSSTHSPPTKEAHKSLSHEKLTESKNEDGTNKAALGAGIGVGFVILVLLVVCLVWCCRRKKRKQNKNYYYASPSKGKAANNYYNTGQQSLPHWQPGAGPHMGEHVVRVQQQQQQQQGMGMGMQMGMGMGMGPPSGGWGTSHPQMSSGDMSSNYSAGMGSSSPGLPLTLKSGTFTYEELAAATKGFANDQIIGQGGFGYVHKGVLPNGKEVAVKSLKAGSGQGEREFQAEIEIISRVHHRHLVSLVGYCICGGQRMLVYEFVPNSTLEHHLHGKGMPTMDWPTRMRIAIGSAKGLAYLHEDCSPRIIHRDIKASNVLLDLSFEAKVSDFGLAKLTSDTNTHVSTRVMGTFGYLAPEYASSGKLTEKSDVFSFGVMLLELITGKRPVDPTNAMEDSLVDWARPLLNKGLEDGNFGMLVDPFLEGNYNAQEMTRMAACAAASIRHSAKKRSKMSQIVRALEGDVSLEDLKDGMKLTTGNGNSGAYPSSSGSSEYDTMQYNADMAKFRQAIMSSQEFNDSGELSSKEIGYH
ncbi:hypothetical protein LR48_Vigan01g186200 [Vigna angularis]|uniref:non-specific serine/threonine protein kinase n=2 Tax=Phaseolus angularis TaxID=3914 RepID=A0A0L9TPA9_PHAAN|nr:proline-rich receptor-like protein kinase PERK4 [Vigna angularis]KOM32306.1 hypothetical protein LR48_Vigan01g186200 [Vigna angularis]BAT75486.1 hypothetical protein VIGAN_01335700 [Vigna angularis var. angularis]